MKKILASIALVLGFVLPLAAGNIQMIDGSELESVSAQGFTFNFQTFDAAFKDFSMLDGKTLAIRPRVGNIVDSVMISGHAQENAFAPVNAANSAVNQAINIVIIMNSNVKGGINISNLMGALNFAP